jgi:hypothetical protein
MSYSSVRNRVFAYLNRQTDIGTLGGTDMFVTELNAARRLAQRQLNFELLKTLVLVNFDSNGEAPANALVDVNSGETYNANVLHKASFLSGGLRLPLEIGDASTRHARETAVYQYKFGFMYPVPSSSSVQVVPNVPLIYRSGDKFVLWASPAATAGMGVGSKQVLLEITRWLPDYSESNSFEITFTANSIESGTQTFTFTFFQKGTVNDAALFYSVAAGWHMFYDKETERFYISESLYDIELALYRSPIMAPSGIFKSQVYWEHINFVGQETNTYQTSASAAALALDGDFFVEELADWTVFQILRNLSLLLKDNMTVNVTQAVLDRHWESVIQWNGNIADAAGATPVVKF